MKQVKTFRSQTTFVSQKEAAYRKPRDEVAYDAPIGARNW